MSSDTGRLPTRQGPLADLRVLELGTLIAGPFAGRWLADFGADVIKIEQPSSGDPLRRWGRSPDGGDSLWHLVQSRGKRSVTADLHDRDDQRLVRRLALESDILIENFRPGRLEAWNLDPADLIEANPRLVVVRISGYGQTGPLRDQPGFGTIAEAAGGLRYLTGEPDTPTTRVGLSLGDSIASLEALIGMLVALHERERSGQGQIVDVALTDALFSMLEGILPEYSYFGVVRERTGNIAHNSAPTNAYLCADGADVCIAANTTRLSGALFRAIGRDDLAADPELATDRGRVRRAAELDDAIAAWARSRTAADVVATLRRLHIPVSRINSIADIVADPQFAARDMLVPVEDPRLSRPLLVPGITPKLSRTPGRVPRLAAPLGADTEAVMERVRRAESPSSRATGCPPGPERDHDTGETEPLTAMPAGHADDVEPRARVVQTYRGTVDAEALGVTLMHEHLFVRDPELERNLAGLEWDEPRFVETAVAALAALHELGVRTIVDLTVVGLGRDVRLVRSVAERVPVEIVASTGLYTATAVPLYFAFRGPGRTVGGPEPLVELFVRDIEEGIAGTSIRASMIKVMSGAAGMTEGVERVMMAAAIAHQQTGVPITTHSEASLRNGLEQQAWLTGHGVSAERIIIGHAGDSDDLDYLRAIMDNGSTIGMDRFGTEHVRDDGSRIDMVASLVDLGYADRMVLSHDAAFYSHVTPPSWRAVHAPRWDMEHLFRRILPALRERGVSQADLDQMLIANPAWLLAPGKARARRGVTQPVVSREDTTC